MGFLLGQLWITGHVGTTARDLAGPCSVLGRHSSLERAIDHDTIVGCSIGTTCRDWGKDDSLNGLEVSKLLYRLPRRPRVLALKVRYLQTPHFCPDTSKGTESFYQFQQHLSRYLPSSYNPITVSIMILNG